MVEIEKACEDENLSVFWYNLKKETRINSIGSLLNALIKCEKVKANKTEADKKNKTNFQALIQRERVQSHRRGSKNDGCYKAAYNFGRRY